MFTSTSSVWVGVEDTRAVIGEVFKLPLLANGLVDLEVQEAMAKMAKSNGMLSILIGKFEKNHIG